MAQRISILFILIAIGTFLAHSIIPHHEHEDKICFETCHGESNEANENKHDSSICNLKNQEFIRGQEEHNSKSSPGHGGLCDCHFPPILLLINSFFDFDFHTPPVTGVIPYFNLYTSVELYPANFYRGPPQS